MSEIPNDVTAQQTIETDIAMLGELVPQAATDNDFLARIEYLRSTITRDNYSHSRSIGEVAAKLGLSTTKLRKALGGCAILDIGAGNGTFARQIAKDKSAKVVALERDPKLYSDIPTAENLTKICGDAYDLSACELPTDSFDAIFATYSTSYWPESENELQNSVLEPLDFMGSGSKLFFTPIAQDLGIYYMHLKGLAPPRLKLPKTEMRNSVLPCAKVAYMFYGFVKKLADDGLVDIAFRESTKNRTFKKLKLPDNTWVSPNSFSAIITKH